MKIKRSHAFKKFKQEIGQANHFLITILIGLDGVKSRKVCKNPEFNASWNPKDVEASAERSRRFALNSSLAWVVDCLDMYLRLCNRKPKLIDDNTSSQFDQTHNSVYKKYLIIKNHCDNDIEKAAVDLLIAWRNKMTHYYADNDISKDSRDAFKTKKYQDEWMNNLHLDFQRMLQNFDDNCCPSFKEVAFMISQTIRFVEDIDKELIGNISAVNYMDETICFNLKEKPNDFAGIFTKEADIRRSHLCHYFQSYGIVIEKNEFDEDEQEYFDKLVSISYQEAKEKLEEGSFI